MAAQTRPPFDVPAGAVAKVSIIDSSMRLTGMPMEMMVTPLIEGWDRFPTVPTWSFLVESPSGKKALFDLGLHKDFSRLVPQIADLLAKSSVTADVKEHVADIIKRHGVDPKTINSVIWSHYHFDHTGDPTTFPSSTELVVGPGFKEAVMPGYPANPESPIREQDLQGRNIREIEFAGELKAGPFQAVDFFGDGSFYLLNTPGHCVGHLAGLARTSKAGQDTDSDTFILMGGDLCHHGGEIRPSPYLPLPDPLPSWVGGLSHAAFRGLNIRRGRDPAGPFMDSAIVSDEEKLFETIRHTQIADADPNVWIVIAHETAVFDDEIKKFPETANDWKVQGWKEKTMWKFLEDFAPPAKLHSEGRL